MLGLLAHGCADIDGETDDTIGCEDVGGAQCVDESHPLDIDIFDNALVVGEEESLSVLVHDSLDGYRIVSSDSSVVEVEDFELGDVFVTLRALGAGQARIHAYPSGDSLVLDYVDIYVE